MSNRGAPGGEAAPSDETFQEILKSLDENVLRTPNKQFSIKENYVQLKTLLAKGLSDKNLDQVSVLLNQIKENNTKHKKMRYEDPDVHQAILKVESNINKLEKIVGSLQLQKQKNTRKILLENIEKSRLKLNQLALSIPNKDSTLYKFVTKLTEKLTKEGNTVDLLESINETGRLLFKYQKDKSFSAETQMQFSAFLAEIDSLKENVGQLRTLGPPTERQKHPDEGRSALEASHTRSLFLPHASQTTPPTLLNASIDFDHIKAATQNTSIKAQQTNNGILKLDITTAGSGQTMQGYATKTQDSVSFSLKDSFPVNPEAKADAIRQICELAVKTQQASGEPGKSLYINPALSAPMKEKIEEYLKTSISQLYSAVPPAQRPKVLIDSAPASQPDQNRHPGVRNA